MQTTNKVLMVRPVRFAFNEETAANNAFQVKTESEQQAQKIQQQIGEIIKKYKLEVEKPSHTHFRYFYLDRNHIFERGGRLVGATDGGDGRYHSFCLHPVEAVAELVHPVHPCFLHKPDVIGMVHNAHSVTFIVFYNVFVWLHIC